MSKGDKARIYYYVKEWDGNPISYGYLSELTNVNKARVCELCIELENEKLVDRDTSFVWLYGKIIT